MLEEDLPESNSRAADTDRSGRLMVPPEALDYLDSFRERHTAGEVRGYVERLSSLKVLALGEAILDEYVYCDALGKSGKEPILAMRYLSREMYAGGILAISNHLAEFCRQVDLLTYLGAERPHERFIRERLRSEVTPTFFRKPSSPTIVKRRYVEYYSLAKLFGVYRINDEPLSGVVEDQLCEELGSRLAEADVVIVADYGHGLITPRMVDLLIEKSRFLAVNTQMNAANIGFHTISKYRRADYVCIQEGELRHDSRSRDGDVRELVRAQAKRLSCKACMTTRGKYGSLHYRQDEGFSECPAFAVKIVDRIGAGDALLALTSLCEAQGVPTEVVGLLGNLAGAQAVATVGNKESIHRAQLLRRVDQLLG